MSDQWIRKCGLILFQGEKGLDLSNFRIKFSVQNADVETPNNCAIRVYNLSKQTIVDIAEFGNVVLNAGYVNGNYGVIFQGTIKQYRVGRENNTDTFLDILASDGDILYNQGIVNTTLVAGTTQNDQIRELAKSMKDAPVNTLGLKTDKQHIPNLRGTVLFGMARARMRNVATNLDASWSIQDGKVTIIDRRGYLEGEAVEINIGTGLIGIPEQTDGGIYVRCLLNSRLKIGGAVKLNNSEITQLIQRDPNAAPIAYNQRTSLQHNAPLSPDGIYRAFVVEHEGDTRGPNWYSQLVCLAIDPTVPETQAVSNN